MDAGKVGEGWDWPSGLAAWTLVSGVAVGAGVTQWHADLGSATHAVAIKLAIWWLLLLLIAGWSRCIAVVRSGLRRLGSSPDSWVDDLGTGLASIGVLAWAVFFWVLLPSRLGSRPLFAFGPVVVALVACAGIVRAGRLLSGWAERFVLGRRGPVAWLVAGGVVAVAARTWKVTADSYARRYFPVHLLSAMVLLAAAYLLLRPLAAPTGGRKRPYQALVLAVSVLGALTFLAAPPSEGTRRVVFADTLMRAAFALAPTIDADGDGYGRSWWFSGGDCDDANAAVHPGAIDLTGNGVDENCLGGDLAAPHPELRPPTTPAGSGSGKRRSILLLVLDAFRFERGTRFGFAPDDAPNLAALAQQARAFSRLRMCSSFTSTSIGFLFRGARRQETTDVVNHLKSVGYHTIHHSEAWEGKPSAGFIEHGGGGKAGELRFEDQTITDQIVARLQVGLPDPFFLYVHLLDLHFPHRPTPPCRASDPPAARYRCLLRRIDANVGRLVEALRQSNRLDDTVVAVLGDHGEELGEHGAVAHASSIYEEVLRVPFLLQVPAAPPARTDLPLSCFDILPTILDAARQPTPPWLLGGSKLDPAAAAPSTQWAAVDYKEVSLRAVIRDEVKLLYDQSTTELVFYDLRADPDERRPLGTTADPRAGRLVPALDAWISEVNQR